MLIQYFLNSKLRKLLSVQYSISAMYRAVRVDEFGASDVLKIVNDLPIPKPDDYQVLVEVHCSGVNPVDTYIRSGTYAALPSLPYTPGRDAAGIVKNVGANVTKFKVGDRVFLTHAGRFGTLSEYVATEQSNVFRLAERLSFAEGAALGVPYFTAYRSLFILARGKPGQRVLVHGASGGVGQAVVQLAVGSGMQVVGTAGTTEGMEIIKQMGADTVYCHKEQDYLKKMATCEDGFNIIVEMLSNVNLGEDLSLLKPRGTVVIVGCRGPVTINPRLLMSKESSIVGCLLPGSTKEEWEETGTAIEVALSKGIVKPRVSKRYTLEQASAAHDDVISGVPTLGKLVVDVKSS